MYRIKTKSEFIDEFGEDFHHEVDAQWNSDGDMDYLFGQEITSSEYNDLGDGDEIKIDGWSISCDMVTDKPLPESTQPKSLLDCHGWEFQATIRNTECKGKIAVNGKRVFLCQNKEKGLSCDDKQGFKHSFALPIPYGTGLTINFSDVKNFKLLNNNNYVKESSSKSEVCRPDSSGKPVGTRIGIHSRDIIPTSGCRPIGSKATNFWQGERVATGKVKQNFIQSY